MFRNGGSCGCCEVCGWGLWGDTQRRFFAHYRLLALLISILLLLAIAVLIG